MTTAEITQDRRRVETWNAIHNAAATLALERSLALATIDEIAAMAGVSRRTFFNYFQTKEDAVLGLELPEVSDDALEAFLADDGDVLGSLVRFVFTVSFSTTRLAPDVARRRHLIEQLPELRVRIQDHSRVSESLIAPVLEQKLGMDADGSGASAKALQMLAGTIVRFAFSEQSNHADITVSDLDVATETFRNLLKDNR